MAIKVQIRRGTKAQLTTYGALSAGELGFTTDEKLVYVGVLLDPGLLLII